MNSTPTRRYLVVEDIAETRAWLIENVRVAFNEVAYGAPDLRSARTWLRATRHVGEPLLALVDLGLPDGDGTRLIEEIMSEDPTAAVIVTTIFEDDGSLMKALAAGAQGYLLKDRDHSEIARRLAAIDQGEIAISPTIARRLLHHFRAEAPNPAALSPRETEVLRLVGRGLTSNEVANVLQIGQQTVATHIKTIYRKLEISSRAEAALEARKRGLT